MGMNGFEPIEYSPCAHGDKWRTKDTVETFLGSDEVCVGKDFGEDAVKACNAFRQFIRVHKYPVRVFRRGNVVGLLKEER